MGIFQKAKVAVAEHEAVATLKGDPAMYAKLQQNKALIGDLFQDVMVGTIIWTGLSPSPQALKFALVMGVVGTVLSKAGLISSDAEAQAKAKAATLAPSIQHILATAPDLEKVTAEFHDQLEQVKAARATATAPVPQPTIGKG